MTRFTLDIFHGESIPNPDFIEWSSGWWYHTKGIPVSTGCLPNGDKWLLFGWFLTGETPQEIISRFKLKNDPEVLFKADGQFILVFCSSKGRNVKLFRDRTGIFPLVYAKGDRGIALSVCVENVEYLSGCDRIHSKTVLEQWPVYRLTIPPDTQYKNIKCLSGRHSLSISNNEITEEPNDMALPLDDQFNNLVSASNELGAVLFNSVVRRIDTHTKIGALLSGGNDSSLLVALMRKKYSGNIKTVFVTFEGNPRDYGSHALHVAKEYDTDHMTICLSPAEYVAHWSEAIDIIQSPLNHPNTIGRVVALKKLQGSVDVMTAGEGADTVFGGPYYAPMLLLSKIGAILPDSARSIIRRASKMVPRQHIFTKALAMGMTAVGTPLEVYLHSFDSFGTQDTVDRIFQDGVWEKAVDRRKSLSKGDPFKGLFSFHMLYWIPQYVAVETRLGLHNGIYFLYPFLDYKLIQASLRLPLHLRYHYSTKKAVLKRYCLNYFDKKFVFKPKEGFGVPLSKWFAMPELEPFLNLPLEERSLKRGWWNKRALREIIDMHRSGKGTDKTAESIPWITTNLELWARICLEGDSPDLYK